MYSEWIVVMGMLNEAREAKNSASNSQPVSHIITLVTC
jgi:hypothetical protein